MAKEEALDINAVNPTLFLGDEIINAVAKSLHMHGSESQPLKYNKHQMW